MNTSNNERKERVIQKVMDPVVNIVTAVQRPKPL